MQWNLKIGQKPTLRDLYRIIQNGERPVVIDHRSDPPKSKPAKPKSKK